MLFIIYLENIVELSFLGGEADQLASDVGFCAFLRGF